MRRHLMADTSATKEIARMTDTTGFRASARSTSPTWTTPTGSASPPQSIGQTALAAAPFRPLRRGSTFSVYSGDCEPIADSVRRLGQQLIEFGRASSVRGVHGEAGAGRSLRHVADPQMATRPYPWHSGTVSCGPSVIPRRRSKSCTRQRRSAFGRLSEPMGLHRRSCFGGRRHDQMCCVQLHLDWY